MSDLERQKLDEAIDACRPLSDDLDQPEFAELAKRIETDAEIRHLFERSQAFDTAVARAIKQDADVPAGLAERLLASLASMQQPESPSDGQVSLKQASGESVSSDSKARRAGMSRRRWLLGLVSAGSVAAALCIGAGLYARRTLATDEVVTWATDWPDTRIDGTGWKPFSEEIDGYPIPLTIASLPSDWQMVSTELSSETVAYDLSGTRPAYLFVARTWRDCSQLPNSPPNAPQHVTGPWYIAVWRNSPRRNGPRHCVYALAFKGPRTRYRDLIQASSGLAQSLRSAPMIP